jgi:hypothetical protein
MAATVTIYEANGGTDGTPGTHTRVDGQNLGNGVDVDVRFCTADAYNDIAVHPCIIPAAGSNFSYWKHLYLNIATGTGFTTVNNIRFYTDGTIGWTCGTGGGLYVGIRDSGDNGTPMDASYEVATGVVGTSGHDIDDVTNGHTYYKDQTAPPALASNYTAGATLLVDSADYSVADDSDAIVLNVKLATDATQGTQAAETLTFLYDEI